MKLTVFLVYLMVCFAVFSCSHNPYDNFQEIKVGDDKADVLDKVGSPLRSHFQNGKNIWTYRFYSKAEDKLVYKDIILDSEKVLDIKNSKEVDFKEEDKKEKMVEQSIKETKKIQPNGKSKPAVDDSILNDSSKKKDDSTFTPVE
jgi:hypothetical protein